MQGLHFNVNEVEFTQAIMDTLRDNGFKNYNICIDSDYAASVEYGYTGARPIPYAKWRDWAMSKPDFYLLPPKERNKKIYFSYKKACEQGTAPHPYIRPTLDYYTNGSADNESYFNSKEGGTMRDLAEDMADRMRLILDSNGSVVTGALMHSIHVEEGRGDDES